MKRVLKTIGAVAAAVVLATVFAGSAQAGGDFSFSFGYQSGHPRHYSRGHYGYPRHHSHSYGYYAPRVYVRPAPRVYYYAPAPRVYYHGGYHCY